MEPKTITIDGPAGSGKSTVGGALADALGYAMLDSGSIYRFLTQRVLDAGCALDDDELIRPIVESVTDSVDVNAGSKGFRVFFGDVPLGAGGALHTALVNASVPHIAKKPFVREAVRKIQRAAIDSGPTIVAGRDIGTTVAPTAGLKLYLDVSIEERAARRMWSRGHTTKDTEDEIAKELQTRDDIDMQRESSPLRIPGDALVLRTDRLSVHETVDLIVSMCGLQRGRLTTIGSLG